MNNIRYGPKTMSYEESFNRFLHDCRTGCDLECHDIDQDSSGSQGSTGPQGPQGPQGPRGPQGPQGPRGPLGPPGANGLSAYEVYVESTGGSGTMTEEEWLQSLEGPQGDPGPAGQSAYEIYVDQGGTLDESEWLESLQGPQGNPGPQGATGQSAYEVYVDQGGTLNPEDWLNSLEGPQGDPGPAGQSAYEIYVESVPEGEVPLTESEWLESLQGPAGQSMELVETPCSPDIMQGNIEYVPEDEAEMPQNLAYNINPLGTGWLAQVPSEIDVKNCRGVGAVDWQTDTNIAIIQGLGPMRLQVITEDVEAVSGGNYSSITGGMANYISTVSEGGSITGGILNRIGNVEYTSSDMSYNFTSISYDSGDQSYSIIAGGMGNVADGIASSILGGTINTVLENYSTIVGGTGNIVADTGGSAIGTNQSTVIGQWATIIGGDDNLAMGTQSSIIGSSQAVARGDNSAVLSSVGSTIEGNGSVVIGGHGHQGHASAENSVILGGQSNQLLENHEASLVTGIDNSSTNVNSVVLGQYNSQSLAEMRLVVGGGLDTSTRANILEFDAEGNLEITSAYSVTLPVAIDTSTSLRYDLNVGDLVWMIEQNPDNYVISPVDDPTNPRLPIGVVMRGYGVNAEQVMVGIMGNVLVNDSQINDIPDGWRQVGPSDGGLTPVLITGIRNEVGGIEPPPTEDTTVITLPVQDLPNPPLASYTGYPEGMPLWWDNEEQSLVFSLTPIGITGGVHVRPAGFFEGFIDDNAVEKTTAVRLVGEVPAYTQYLVDHGLADGYLPLEPIPYDADDNYIHARIPILLRGS